MIKKLKMRFVLVNMIMLSMVLFATLSSIYILMAKSEYNVSEEIIDTLMENHKKNMSDSHFFRPPPEFSEKPDSSSYKKTVNQKYFEDAPKLVPLEYVSVSDESETSETEPGPFEFDWNEYWFNYWNNAWAPEGGWDCKPWNGWPAQDPGFPYIPSYTQVPESEITSTASQDDQPVQNSVTEAPESASHDTDITTTLPPSVNAYAAQPAVTQSEYISTALTQSDQTQSEVTSEAGTNDTVTSPPPVENTSVPKNPKPAVTSKYNGNLIRSNIFIVIDENFNVNDISFQYFQHENDEELEDYKNELTTAVKNIMNSGISNGKYKIGTISYRYKISSSPDKKNYYMLLLDRSIEISTLSRLRVTFFIIGCIGLVVVFFISLAVSNWAVKPTELAWSKQKQFIADASHELKTPLTVISANTDVLLSNPHDCIENQERWIRYIKAETVRMSKLVNELLYIAKSDSNEIKMEKSEFDISNTVSTLCLVFESMIFESGRTLLTDITPNLKYFGDEDRIKQLITILLDNSMKYSVVHTDISASLFRNNQGKIKFCISNKCDPIEKENLPKLFDRFYRLDDSRNSLKGGNGLGLNIAQTIALAHGGSISVQYNYGIISFTVVF